MSNHQSLKRHHKEEVQLPQDWRFWYAEGGTNPHSEDEWNKFVEPDVQVLTRDELTEEEQELFILYGDQVTRVSKEHGAWYGGFNKSFALDPGATYRFTVHIYPDLVKEYKKARKVWANDPQGLDGLARFVGMTEASQNKTTIHPWRTLTPGEWNTLTLDFISPDRDVQLGIDVMCPFALVNNALYFDDWTLQKLIDPRGAPRQQYARVVNVIPKTATDAQVLAICLSAWENGQTVTGSYDEAGIGALEERTAVLWGIHPEMHEEYTAWYERFYPGTAVQFKELPE